MEDIGYGIHKMMGWEQLTGEKVTFDSDIDSSTVTYYRRKIGSKNEGSTTPVTTPVPSIDDKIIQIIRATPNITRAEIGKILRMTVNGVKYHNNKLRKAGRLEWEGHSRTGRWVIKK